MNRKELRQCLDTGRGNKSSVYGCMEYKNLDEFIISKKGYISTSCRSCTLKYKKEKRKKEKEILKTLDKIEENPLLTKNNIDKREKLEELMERIEELENIKIDDDKHIKEIEIENEELRYVNEELKKENEQLKVKKDKKNKL